MNKMILLLLISVMFFSCDSGGSSGVDSSSLVGTWVGTDKGLNDMTGEILTLNADGSFSDLWDQGTVDEEVDYGTWSQSGDILILVFDGASQEERLIFSISGNDLTLTHDDGSGEYVVYTRQ